MKDCRDFSHCVYAKKKGKSLIESNIILYLCLANLGPLHTCSAQINHRLHHHRAPQLRQNCPVGIVRSVAGGQRGSVGEPSPLVNPWQGHCIA